MNTNRFKQLLESKMGDVRPLITEEPTTGTTQPVAASGGQAKTNQPINYLAQLSTTYKDQPVPGGGTFRYKGENPEVPNTLQFYAIGKPQNDMDKFVIQNLGLGGMLYNVYCEDIDKRDKLFSDSYEYFKKGEKVKSSITPIKMDEPTKIMLQRYCMAKFPDAGYAYYQTTPKY